MRSCCSKGFNWEWGCPQRLVHSLLFWFWFWSIAYHLSMSMVTITCARQMDNNDCDASKTNMLSSYCELMRYQAIYILFYPLCEHLHAFFSRSLCDNKLTQGLMDLSISCVDFGLAEVREGLSGVGKYLICSSNPLSFQCVGNRSLKSRHFIRSLSSNSFQKISADEHQTFCAIFDL